MRLAIPPAILLASPSPAPINAPIIYMKIKIINNGTKIQIPSDIRILSVYLGR
nr:MAG TPA: hypothetical protein [Caudoviricetes sp.]